MPSFRKRNNYISRNNKRQRIGRRYSRGLAALRKRKRGTSGRGLTFEHDRQFIYRKKSMPYRKKRRWRKFIKKVGAVQEKELGTRMCLFNKQTNFTNSASGNQGVTSISLYGWSSDGGFGGKQSWYNDIAYMAELENNTTQTLLGQYVGDDVKMIFSSGVLDMTIRNTSYKDAPGTLNPDATLELDLYECYVKKECEMNGVNYQTLGKMLELETQGIYNQNLGAEGDPIKINYRGATPFDCSVGLKAFGIKILKKTKFFLRSGQTLTYQVRDPKRHIGYRRKLQDTIQGDCACNKPGWTKHILIIFKVVPGITVGSGAGETREDIQIGVTRKYKYYVEGVREDRSIKVNR